MEKKNLPSEIEPKPISFSRLFLNPYGRHEYRFDVGLPAHEVLQKLRDDTARMLSFDILMRSKSFAGSINNDSFKLNWIKTNVRNSWAPLVTGHVTPQGNRTKLVVSFRVHPVIIVFMLLWMTGATFVAVTFALSMSREGYGPAAYLAMLFPVFGVLLVSIGVLVGRNQQRTILKYFNNLPDTIFIEEGKFIE